MQYTTFGMYEFMLMLHIAVVFLYIGLFLIRANYLLTGKEERFLLFSERARSSFIILVTILIITGIYLSLNYDFQASGIWFLTKLVVMGAAVVIGNYAMYNYHRGLTFVTLVLIVYVILLSFQKNVALYPAIE